MELRNKLRLGFWFIFLAVIYFGLISWFYLHKIYVDSNVILKDNYESLRYVRKIRAILDHNRLPLSKALTTQLNTQLGLEERSAVEDKERKAVLALRKAFVKIIDPAVPIVDKQKAVNYAHLQLQTIDELNINAILSLTLSYYRDHQY